MSFFSQIGIVLLIAGITIILLRTNRDLERACEEGEHFVDEWAMLLEKRAETKGTEAGRVSEEKRFKGRISEERSFEGRASEERSFRERASEERRWREEEPLERQEEGSPEFGFVPEGARHDYDPALLPLLQMVDEEGHLLGKVRVNRLPFVIGRDPSCDLRLRDLCVARRHCRIVAMDGKLVLEDLGTRNRLAADGRETDRVLLVPGCQVRIGETTFSVMYPKIPASL